MKKCDVGTEVQTLIFSKDNFTEKSAKDWAKKHDFKYGYVDEKENTYRIRQQEPSDFENMRTIEMSEGVKAVIGCPIDEYAEGGGVNISEARIQDAIAHSSKKPEEILSEEVNTDTPKKLNRSEEVVPMSIINEIENEGISIERLESLGLPVYKYQTQITIHGIFEGLTKERVGGYKNLTLNQNKTLGVRYNAIDLEKKKLISNALRLDRYQNEDLASKGFRSRMDSKGFVLSKAKSSQDKSKALEYAKEFKQEAEALPYNFIGGKYVNIYNVYGIYYVEYSIYLNAIRQDNLWGFISAITDGRIDEKKYQEILSLKEAKEKEERADYEKELEEKNRIADEKAKELNNQSPYQSITQLPNAREFAIGFVQSSYGSADIKVYYIFYNKQNRRVFRKKTYKDWADVLPSISKEPTYMEKNLLMPDADLERLNKKVSNGGYFLISETPSAKIIDKKIEIKSEKPKDNTSLDSNDIYEFVETKHTKTGDTIYVLRIKKRLSPAEYKTVEANIKLIRGYYSGFVKGFVLKSKITKNEIERLFEGTSLATPELPKSESSETLTGGKADNKTIEEIAAMHNVTVEYAKEQLEKGIEIESEHTSDREKATEISKDHLTEFINYYIELKKMETKLEQEAEKEVKNKKNIDNITIKYKAFVPYVGYSRNIQTLEPTTLVRDYKNEPIFKDNGRVEFENPDFYSYGYLLPFNYNVDKTKGWVFNKNKSESKNYIELYSNKDNQIEQKFLEIKDLYWIFKGKIFDFPEDSVIKTKNLTEKNKSFRDEYKIGNSFLGYGKKDYVSFDGGDTAAIDMNYDTSIEKSNKYYAIYFGDENDGLFERGLVTHCLPNAYLYARQYDVQQAHLLTIENGKVIDADDVYPYSDSTDLQEIATDWLNEYYGLNLKVETKLEQEAEKTTDAPFKFEVGEYVMIIDEPITNNENIYRVIGHANYNSDYGWQITIKNLYSNETVTMFENQLQISDKSEQIKEIIKELKESFSEIQQEDINLHLKVRLEGIESETELQKAKENYPIVIEWSEGNIPDNVGLNNLDELNSKLIQAGFSSRPTEIYRKNKVWFRGYPSYVRIDVSKQRDDFDFEKQHIRDWLKKYDSKFDWSVFDTKEEDKSQIEELEMLIELTQDALNENPNDEELSMYLEMLKETLSELKNK